MSTAFISIISAHKPQVPLDFSFDLSLKLKYVVQVMCYCIHMTCFFTVDTQIVLYLILAGLR